MFLSLLWRADASVFLVFQATRTFIIIIIIIIIVYNPLVSQFKDSLSKVVLDYESYICRCGT